MPSAVRIIDRDRGWRALLKRTGDMARKRGVTVGVHSGEGGAPEGDSGLSVLDVATIHEFGLGNNPERSFVRNFAEEIRDEAKDAERKIAESVVRGKQDVDEGLERFGLWLVSKMQERIRGGIAPPNDPVTIARKGSSTPLINFGQLVGSIMHKVE